MVCPSTLVAHWVYEAASFFAEAINGSDGSDGPGGSSGANGPRAGGRLRPLGYTGSPAQRRRILKSEQFRDSRLVVTSYNTLMRDQDELAKFTWGFVVLDEGHAIAGGAKVTPFLRSLRWC